MAIDVGEIVAYLKADTSEFSAGIDNANKQLDSMGDGLKGASSKMGELGQSLIGIGSKLSVASGALGGLGIMAAKEFGKYAEQVGMVSDRTGLSQQKLQELGFALNTVGLEIGDLEPGMKRFATTLDKALGGDKESVAKFKALGLDIEQLRRMNPDQLFDALADAIGKIDDPLTRSAAAVDIFGRGGTKLIPFFKDGAEGFNKLGQEAHQLGAVFTDDTLAKMAAMDDAFDKLESTISATARTFGSSFAGPLQEFATLLTQSLGAVNQWWQGLDEGTKKVVLIFVGVFAATGPILVVIGSFMAAVAAGFGPLMAGGAIVASLIAGVASIVANWEALKGKTIVAWTQLKTAVMNTVQDMIEGVRTWLVNKLNAIIEPVRKFADSVVNAFNSMATAIVFKSIVPDMVEEIGDHMRLLDKNMVAPARTAARGTFQVFRELAGDVNQEMAEISNTAISTWSNVTSSMSNALATQIIKGNDWKQTMESISIQVLSSFINLGVQMLTQAVIRETAYAALILSHGAMTTAEATTEVATNEAKNAALLASDAATAGGLMAIWETTSTAVVSSFGAMTAAIGTFFAETIIPMFVQVGEAVIAFLTAEAASLDLSIFGAPLSIPVWAAVGLMAAAVGAISAFAFGAFAQGGVVKGPMMGLVGEAGPEAIIPLDKLPSLMGGGKQTIIVQISEREIARAAFQGMPSVMRVRGISA